MYILYRNMSERITEEIYFRGETKMKIAYLGPKGTFTEEALQGYLAYKNQTVDTELFSTIEATVEAVLDSRCDLAFVPIENSLGGAVISTSDALATEENLVICDEVVIPIRHYLWAIEGATPASVKEIYSHPQALIQCKRYLQEYLPEAALIETPSTAGAAAQVREEQSLDRAAIGSKALGQAYGLVRLTEEIQDNKLNATRFVVLRRRGEPSLSLDKPKISVVCELDGLRPGSLYEGLHIFAKRHINLVRIESRPAKGRLGEYKFFFDLANTEGQTNMAEALAELEKVAQSYRLLGCYEVWEVK